MYIPALKRVNTDILLIQRKLIINLTIFMLSLCIFIINFSKCVKIIIIFRKFEVVTVTLLSKTAPSYWGVFTQREEANTCLPHKHISFQSLYN